MKTKSLLLLSLIFLISCKNETPKIEISKDEIIKQNIGNKLKGMLKNPDSYEFVSMDLAQSFTVKERKENITKANLEEMRELNKTIPSPDLLDRMETEYSYLKNQTDDNKIALYRYNFVAKGTNSFGGIIQSKYSTDVLNDKNYTVLNISKND